MSIITGISIAGVGVGVLTMVVTLSVMAGFEEELKKRLFAAETHILVESNQGYFKFDQALIERIESAVPTVEKIYPVLQAEVIVRSGKKVAGSVLKGVGSEQLDWIQGRVVEWAPSELREAAGNVAPIYLGSELAFDMGVAPGDLLTIVSPVETEGPFGAIPRVKRFLVDGVYKTGVPEQELHVAFAAIRDVESFLKRADILSQIEVLVPSLDEAPAAARAIESALGSGFLVRSWQTLNAHLFQSLRLERAAMFAILIFIVIVASFNIVSTLTMMVLEKKRSLSILRAMGATRKQVAAIFLWEGLSIGIFGVFGGAGLGLLICWILSRYPIIELPEVFYDRTLPVIVKPEAVGVVVVAAMLVVLLGALAPARKASQLPPIQGIREG